MSILTPEQIEQAIGKGPWKTTDDIPIGFMDVAFVDWCDTLAAYAKVVQKVAESDPRIDVGDYESEYLCRYCNADDDIDYDDGGNKISAGIPHKPDCLWLQARKLLGM